MAAVTPPKRSPLMLLVLMWFSTRKAALPGDADVVVMGYRSV
jgi:hypothetical protein